MYKLVINESDYTPIINMSKSIWSKGTIMEHILFAAPISEITFRKQIKKKLKNLI